MIIQQRQRTSSSSNSNSTDEQPPRLWRSRYSKRFKPNYNNINNNFNLLEKPPADKIAHAVQAATPANCYYQDNCKHLNNQYQLTEKQLTKLCEMYAAAPMLPAQPLASVDEFMQKPQHDFMPTPTTLSCQSQHESMFTMNSDYDAYLLDFPLLGDDFLLYLARMELKCHFRKFKQVLQSGLCVSGQTINAAKARIEHVDLPEMTQIIVNIGSEDILRGKALVQIQHDFRQLIKEMHNRRFVPVLTTLAPLANYCHSHQICDKVDRFNKFIRSEGKHLRVIDIHSCLINENNIVRFDCYQNGPRSVTGSPEPYVFWNKIGRQRVLQMIEDNLEYNF
ncbi:maternal effect protein oskar isoform X2 [Drosophila busckii]|nr:maternal effect protein oskar isoform X2 [Drosophila busckii]